MRVRVLAVLVAVLALQAVGCSRLCRCCRRDDLRNDRIPPPALNERPVLPANTSGAGTPTGAYGGSGS